MSGDPVSGDPGSDDSGSDDSGSDDSGSDGAITDRMITDGESLGDTYTHGHHDSVLRSHRWRTAENSAAYLVPHLLPGHRVLDVGCGVGTITLDLADLVSPGEVTGIEPVEGVLEGVAASAEARGVTNLKLQLGDVYELGYADDTFDVTHAHQVLQHLSDPVAALGEMGRVTKPGGLIAVRDADYAGMFWTPADPRLDAWLDIYRKVAHHNAAQPDAARHLLAWAHQAGFDDVSVSASIWVFATPEDRAWWGGTWAERSVSSAFATQAIDYGYATESNLKAISEAFRQWSINDDAWFSVVHGELLIKV